MSIEIVERKVDTILRPTGINLAPYVVNPYQGCAFACFFCYARLSKAAQKETRRWGRYVKVKINGLEILEKELEIKNPQKVLIGSTTEPFQPVEKQYGLSRGIIRILNKRKIKYIIMSRSMILGDYIDELDSDLCEGIYFTVDVIPEAIKSRFEPYAVAPDESISLVNRLNDSGIKTVAYFCPLMPFFYAPLIALSKLNPGVKAEVEIVNFQMSGMSEIVETIKRVAPAKAEKIQKMCKDSLFYEQVMQEIKNEVRRISKDSRRDIKIHTHAYAEYFRNIY